VAQKFWQICQASRSEGNEKIEKVNKNSFELVKGGKREAMEQRMETKETRAGQRMQIKETRLVTDNPSRGWLAVNRPLDEGSSRSLKVSNGEQTQLWTGRRIGEGVDGRADGNQRDANGIRQPFVQTASSKRAV
jgi:hypothetical protein